MSTLPPRAFTVGQVAAQLQVNPKQVYELIRTGQLDAFRVGRHWRIHDHEFERFLRGHRADVA